MPAVNWCQNSNINAFNSSPKPTTTTTDITKCVGHLWNFSFIGDKEGYNQHQEQGRELKLILYAVKSGECQNPYNHNPYNHNPYCVEILIGFVEILIGFVEILIGLLEILIGLLEILIGQFRDFDFDFFGSFGCRDLIFQ